MIEEEEDEGEDEDRRRYIKKVEESYKTRYGKTKAEIDAENKHILTTQAKCLNFVKKYPGHYKVCQYCKSKAAPKIYWKWDTDDHVWYRWYGNEWHYWGPSKEGFTTAGWTWYKGYWHHNGWVFKYVQHQWFRWEDMHWVYYANRVDINPAPPETKKICRPFMIMKKAGYPMTLTAKTIPRCKVGQGKTASIYMWKTRKNCRFLGGKLIHQKMFHCKSGMPHVWAKVTRCVKGPAVKKGGFAYAKKTNKVADYGKANGHQTHHYVKVVRKGHITRYHWVKKAHA